MVEGFTQLDWIVVGGYIALLFAMGWFFSINKPKTSKDYFLGSQKMPYWVVAVSVLATTQSAATFLGGPDQGYRGDYTYISTYIGSLIAAIFVARILIPKFYNYNSTTVYEILAVRYNANTMRAAGGMYLVGRLFASGSRLYLAAIAVSMILYSNIDADSIIAAAFIMMALGFLVTFLGGIQSVVWSDLVQFILYFLSALAVLYFLWSHIPANAEDIVSGLQNAPQGVNKLQFLNFDLNFSDPFTLLSILIGFTLLSIGSFGLDQDITQRVLTCKNEKEGGRALIISVIVAVPVVWLFVSIGQLLHIFYECPELMGAGIADAASQEFAGEKVTIFMYYILNELPTGLKGLVTVGVVAAAVSTINSGLNSMSSVIVQDFYKPWREKRAQTSDKHYVFAGQASMALVGIALFLMAVLCFYWQKYTNMPLLQFALSVMVFAYSGLLGVYFTVIFTKRGSPTSVMMALAVGFIITLLQQSYIVDVLGLPQSWKALAFTWQLCIGTAFSFLVCLWGNDKAAEEQQI